MNTYTTTLNGTTYATNATSYFEAARNFEVYPKAIFDPDLGLTRLNGNPMNSEEIEDMGWVEVAMAKPYDA